MAAEASQEGFSSNEGSSALDGYSRESAGGQAGDAGQEGGGDLRHAFKSTRRELDRTRADLQQYTDRLHQVQQRADQSGQIVERLQRALNPESEAAEADPTVEWQNQLDMYLKAAWDADKAGRPIPLTTNLAVQFYQDKIADHKTRGGQIEEIRKLQETVKQLTNPQREVDHRAASNLDANIITYVEGLFGNAPESFEQRKAQYHAIAAQVRGEVDRLMKTMPDVWDQVRRDPGKQQRLVEYVVERNQPPKVRQILEQQRIKDTPLSDGELWSAFREARTELKDEGMRQKAMAEIRQELIGRMMERKKGQSMGLNKMYR